MPAFFLALIAAALATLAGRESVRVARLSQALGASAPRLVVLWVASIASAAFAGLVAVELSIIMAPAAKAMLAAFALILGAIELVVLRARPAPSEPTRSLPAIFLVLLAAQVTDAARLLILAVAASTGGPWLAAAGGALGSGAMLTAAWTLRGEFERRLPLRALRWGAAAALMLAGLYVGLNARGLIG